MTWEQAAQAYLEAVAPLKRPITLHWFRQQLPNFLNTVAPPTPAEMLPEHLTLYLNSLLGRPELQCATAWGYLSRLLPFFRWLAQQGITLWDPTAGLHFPKFERNPKRVLSPREVESFIEAPRGDDPSAARNRVLLEFFYGTGLRLAEVQQLDVTDVQLAAGQVQVRRSKTEPRLVALGPNLSECLANYLSDVRPRLLTDPAQPALWVSKEGRRLSYGGFTTLFKKLSRRCGISVSPHQMRHAFATHILTAGASLRVVQALLDHKSLLATQIYTQLSGQDVLREFRRTHPRARRQRVGKRRARVD